jgi:cyclic pyranopterin monophosphate synthase
MMDEGAAGGRQAAEEAVNGGRPTADGEQASPPTEAHEPRVAPGSDDEARPAARAAVEPTMDDLDHEAVYDDDEDEEIERPRPERAVREPRAGERPGGAERPGGRGPREGRPGERTWDSGPRDRPGERGPRERTWEQGPPGRRFQDRGEDRPRPYRDRYPQQPTPNTQQPGRDFTHFDPSGRARMVDVGAKPDTERTATAQARVFMARDTLRLIERGGLSKGDVLAVAQVAGVMGAKRTPDLIPLCHPLLLSGVDVGFHLDFRQSALEITATVRVNGKTGVEMEALTAVTVAALTVYDMCKAVDREMTIDQVHLVHKAGGQSGEFRRRDDEPPPRRWEGRREDRPDERFPRPGPPDQRRRFDDQRQGFSRPTRRPWRPDDS